MQAALVCLKSRREHSSFWLTRKSVKNKGDFQWEMDV